MATERVSFERTLGALLAADLVAAGLFILLGGAYGNSSAVSWADVLFGFLLVAVAGIPVLAAGAAPVWIVFRWLRVTGVVWFVLAGACLSGSYFLLHVALGLSAESGVEMTFAENLCQPFQLFNLAAATCSGAVAGWVFHRIVFVDRA